MALGGTSSQSALPYASASGRSFSHVDLGVQGEDACEADRAHEEHHARDVTARPTEHFRACVDVISRAEPWWAGQASPPAEAGAALAIAPTDSRPTRR